MTASLYVKEPHVPTCWKTAFADEPHPRRPRCQYYGKMIQMDASLHPWFGRSKTTSIPQAKGRIEPTVSNTTVTPADHIPEMFMPRKAFDNELRHERLICREAKVICCCLPPPRLMSQEPRCQMHRGITFHWLHRTKAPIETVLLLNYF